MSKIRYCCNDCGFFTDKLSHFNKHKKTKKHKQKTMKYICEICNYYTDLKPDLNRHIKSEKHINKVNKYKIECCEKENEICYKRVRAKTKKYNDTFNKDELSGKWVCKCGSKYSYKTGLYKHMRSCENYIQYNDYLEMFENGDIDPIQKMMEMANCITSTTAANHQLADNNNQLLDNNNKLVEKVIELSDKPTTINNKIINNMTINVFLNEHCKDAINLCDFIENVKISLADLTYTKNHGYIKGINNIFQRHLKDLSPTERPIHCNKKKKTLEFYIKDKDKWQMKEIANKKIDKSIHNISSKQMKKVKDWEAEHPNFKNNESELLEWHSIIKQLVDYGENDDEHEAYTNIKKVLGTTIKIKDAMVV